MPPPLYLSSSPANQENASGTSRPQDEEGIGSGRYGERRLSATEKGKGRASDLSMDPDSSGFLQFEDASSRSKRVRKKRRLSAAGEIDPNDLNDDGSLAKKPRPKPNGHVQELPLTAGDRAYFARIEQTALRPPLSDMKGPCPVWAKTRHALQSAAEYLRQPVKTVGASVGIGAGGVARGVILEGQAPGQGVFWGRGKQAGTIVTSM